MPVVSEPVYEGEVSDIMEGGYLCVHKGRPFYEDVIRKNIEWVLRRDKIIKGKEKVGIPAGALCEVNCEDEFYQCDFLVFDETGRIIYRGTSYGHAICDLSEFNKTKDPCDIYAEIKDMNVELHKGER